MWGEYSDNDFLTVKCVAESLSWYMKRICVALMQTSDKERMSEKVLRSEFQFTDCMNRLSNRKNYWPLGENVQMIIFFCAEWLDAMKKEADEIKKGAAEK